MEIRPALRVVGSIKLAAVILVMLCVAMGCATVYEAMHGTPAALAVFYKSWWFEGLLGLFAINVLSSLLARFPWSRRQVSLVIAHSSLLAILGGAWVTKHWGIDGQVSLVEGQSASQFRIAKDSLSVQPGDEKLAREFDLEGTGGLWAVDSVSTPPATVGDLHLTVLRYTPDSRLTERIVNNNPQPNCALEVSLAGADQSSTEWVFAGQNADSDNLPVAVRTTADPAEVDRFLAAPTSQPAAGARTIKVDVKGTVLELSLDDCLAGPVKLGDSGMSLRATRYLPHALVQGKQLVNSSDRPVNPAVEIEITGPAGTSKRVTFARFPEFGSMHGTQDPAGEVKVALNVPLADNAATIEVLVGPDGRMAVRFAPDDGPAMAKELKIGTPVETPWPALQFTVLQRFDRAGREQMVEPVEPPGEDRTPAIQVAARAGNEQSQVWLRKGDPKHFNIAGKHYDLTYGDKIMALGFEVQLDKFRAGQYPGSRQPRSFESHVTLIDSTGARQSRMISMNNPAQCGGYTLFQSSYQPAGAGKMMSVLSVSWDPGQPIVFTGYITLVAGMLYVLVTRMRGR